MYGRLELPPVNVSFDSAVCRVDYDDGAEAGWYTSVIVLLDNSSNTRMERVAAAAEAAIAAAGVNLTVRRRAQQPFHSTLGAVHLAHAAADASGAPNLVPSYPIAAALADINTAIRPGTWHQEPITLSTVRLHLG